MAGSGSAPASDLPRVESSTRGQHVGFVGDSFSVGERASSPDRRWTSVLARAYGWVEHNVAVSGMGYVAGHDRQQDYPAQVARLRSASPSLVIVSGGWNDVAQGFQQARIVAGVRSTLTACSRVVPKARVIVLAPVGAASEPPAALRSLSAAMGGVVTGAGAQFVDLRMPLTGHPEWISDDDLHPNDAGYAALARISSAKLRSIV